MTTESELTSADREPTGAVRSAAAAYFLPPDWARVARLAVPALERLTPGAGVQLLLVTPDADATLELATALAALPAAAGRRIVAATSAARAARLLAPGTADVVIGTPAVLAPAVAANALKLGTVVQLGFVSADELDADEAALASVLAEVPKGAARWLTALEATPGVEALLERHLHKARRITDDVVPAEGTALAVPVKVLIAPATDGRALQGILDELDAPSAVVLATEPAVAAAARTFAAAAGYGESALVQVVEDAVPGHAALVVLLGVPTATAWASVCEAQPAQVVAVIPARQRPALRRLVGAPLAPFGASAAVARARSAEGRRRAELRTVLDAGIPAREVLALEPLLESYDGLEIAAAALRLWERAAAAAARVPERPAVTEAAPARERDGGREGGRDAGRDAGERRFDDRPRGRDRDAGPRSGTGPRFGAGPRGGAGPRSGTGSRGEGRGDRPRGDGPRGGPPRGGPRSAGPRDRGPGGPSGRGDRPSGPPRDRGPRR